MIKSMLKQLIAISVLLSFSNENNSSCQCVSSECEHSIQTSHCFTIRCYVSKHAD